MDKRAAAQYLDTLFGSRAGHVAVAYKHPTEKDEWKETQFAWPSGKTKLLAWAADHTSDNVFICPSLREHGNTRKKADMLPTEWLWADVDWQAVPKDKVSDVQDRIAELGTLVVGSGSGDNVHVYVQLDEKVDHTQFIKLNTGLRDYLFADNKQADNSLLRLPGTTNWKTGQGQPVSIRPIKGSVHSAKALMRKRAFRDAKVIADADASEWSFVEVEGLPRRVRSMMEMTVDEAEARYGNRHKAVWAVTGELNKRGTLSVDQIHSLMDKFPAALSKAADENGYDVHRDVDKRLAYDRAAGLLTEEEHEDIEDDVMELATEEDDAEEFERRVNALVALELERSEARKRARIVEAERSWVPPPVDVSWSLTDALKDPPRPVPHLIEGLCGEKHNVVLTAQYKTGKTAFTMGSIAQALCDGADFLDKFPVNAPPGGVVVGHWNCEMDPYEMMDDYIRPVGINHTNNLHVANLRGYSVNILTPLGKAWAINWLRDRKVKAWTIDSFARLARMAGVSEKDNDEVMGLLMALDQIKVEAEVDVLFLITHTGRSEMEEGKERARGATAIDDWADARWIMTKLDKTRFLRVEGRGVAMEDLDLVYDPDTNRSTAGFGDKAAMRDNQGVQAVVEVVKEHPGTSQTGLYKLLKGRASQRLAAQLIEEAIDAGFIEVREVAGTRGKPAKLHYLTGSLQGTTRGHNATPREVVIPSPRTRQSR